MEICNGIISKIPPNCPKLSRVLYLASVCPGVRGLRVLEAYDPVVCVGRVEGLEAEVGGVGVATDGEEGSVGHADPRDLKHGGINWQTYTSLILQQISRNSRTRRPPLVAVAGHWTRVKGGGREA